MKVFLAIAALLTLALLATNTRFYTFRRSRFVTLLISGGWPAVLVGIMIGPHLANLISDDVLRAALPLVLLALGWIGLMIGLQARWSVLRAIPRALFLSVSIDAALTIFVLGAVLAWAMWWWAGPEASAASLATPVALLIAASIGWSMETRSLQAGSESGSQVGAVAVRVSGALASILAVAILGIAQKLTALDDAGATSLALRPGALALASIFALAIVLAILGRYMISRASRSVGEQLAVFLGLVAFVGGIAAEQGDAPLFAAMLAGVVLANVASPESPRFARFILEAEHVVAIVVFLIAGMVADFNLGPAGLAIAAGIATWRVMVKPMALRLSENDPRDSTTRLNTIRQSPVAVALALGVATVDPSDFSRKLLAIVLLSGITAEIVTFARASRGLREAPAPIDNQPVAEGAP